MCFYMFMCLVTGLASHRKSLVIATLGVNCIFIGNYMAFILHTYPS